MKNYCLLILTLVLLISCRKDDKHDDYIIICDIPAPKNRFNESIQLYSLDYETLELLGYYYHNLNDFYNYTSRFDSIPIEYDSTAFQPDHDVMIFKYAPLQQYLIATPLSNQNTGFNNLISDNFHQDFSIDSTLQYTTPNPSAFKYLAYDRWKYLVPQLDEMAIWNAIKYASVNENFMHSKVIYGLYLETNKDNQNSPSEWKILVFAFNQDDTANL